MKQLSQTNHRFGISGHYGASEFVKAFNQLNIAVSEDCKALPLHSKNTNRAKIFQCACEVFSSAFTVSRCLEQSGS